MLHLTLRLSPAEIDALEMDDYWKWLGVAERKLKRRIDEIRRSGG